MGEREPRGVEKRPVEVSHRANVAGHAAVHAAVERITDDRVADGAEMYPDLMGPAGVNRDVREGQHAPEVLGANDAGDRFPAAADARRLGRHLLAVPRISPDRDVDPPAGHHLAPGERDVFLLDLALAKLP